MSSSDSQEYEWRETYFILFKSSDRPSLTQMELAIGELNDRLILENIRADDNGRFESMRIRSPDDYAAIEISFESGEAVVEQGTDLAKELLEDAEPDEVAKLFAADARLDVMHFEQVVDATPDGPETDENDLDEMLDPSSLLMVVDSLVALTEGVAIDPASGATML